MSRAGIGTGVLLAASLAVGCGGVCPSGTRLRGGPASPSGWQTCQRGAPTIASIPVPGTTFESTLGIAHPTAGGTLLEGPAMQWHPSGLLKAYGQFAISRGRSAPNGLWTYFWPHGARRAQVRYSMGRPVGCVLLWDEAGKQSSHRVVGGELRPATCSAGLDARATALAARYAHKQPERRERFSVALGVEASPATLGLHADGLTPPPRLDHHGRIAVRRRVGPLDVGVAGDVSTAARQSWCAGAGVLGSVDLPIGPRWIDTDVTVELGARRYATVPYSEGTRWDDNVELSTGYAASRLAFGVRLTRNIGVYTTASAEYELSSTHRQSHRFCKAVPMCSLCPPRCWNVVADWQTGGARYAIIAGLRILVP